MGKREKISRWMYLQKLFELLKCGLNNTLFINNTFDDSLRKIISYIIHNYYSNMSKKYPAQKLLLQVSSVMCSTTFISLWILTAAALSSQRWHIRVRKVLNSEAPSQYYILSKKAQGLTLYLSVLYTQKSVMLNSFQKFNISSIWLLKVGCWGFFIATIPKQKKLLQ